VTQPVPATPGAAPQKRHHAREYETIYILRSDVDAEAAERVQARVNDALVRESGKLVKVEAWGRRKLAYPLGKQRRGVYVYLKYVGGGGLVAEVERNLKLQDAVIKFMTVLSGEGVDVENLQIDPEETTLGKLELAPEDEKEESREKQLGLIDLGPEAPRAPRPMDDFDADEREDAEGDERPGAGGGAGAAGAGGASAAGAAGAAGAAAPKAEGQTDDEEG
jgi:small subunit ribosomal protein S6